MPAWLEALLTPITVFAALYLLAWGTQRSLLSRPVRVIGWASVVVTGLAMVGSFWCESVWPYLQTGRWPSLARVSAQFASMVLSAGLMLAGAVRFLRAWRALVPTPPTPAAHATRTVRLRWAAALVMRLLRLPGLGWMAVGLGLILLAGQLGEPDPTLRPDARLLALGIVLLGGGLLQIRWCRTAKEGA